MNKLLLVLYIVGMFAGCGESKVAEPKASQDEDSCGKAELAGDFKGVDQNQGGPQPPSKEPRDLVESQQVKKIQAPVRKERFSGVELDQLILERDNLLVVESVDDVQFIGGRGVGGELNDNMLAFSEPSGLNDIGDEGGFGIARVDPRLNSLGVAMSKRISVDRDSRQFDQGGAPRPFVPGEGPSTEEYDRIYENPFLQAKGNPLSTFSIDVDTASYANSRRFLRDGRLPPKDAVRVEEFINYFDYEYPAPTGTDPFSVNCELAACPWNEKSELLLVGLQGRKIDLAQMPPSNLVFLIDVSGSMNSPRKLPLLKASMRLLVDNLRPEDKVAIVVYAAAAGLVLESTPGTVRQKILGAIDNLRAGGSTAGGAGIQLAYSVAKENFMPKGNNRIILATDGDFNVGESSDAGLTRLVEEKRKDGVFLTVLGFGNGNYKDSKMEKLADKGNGNYAYIDNVREAKKALVTEVGGTLFAIAKDVKLQLEFNPATVSSYRLIGYENRMLKKEDFNDDKKDAGELGAGHRVTALYEIVRVGVEEPVAKVDKLKYQRKVKLTKSKDLLTLKLRYKEPKETESQLITKVIQAEEIISEKPSENWALASAVAEFALLMRDSEHKGTASFEAALTRARKARGKDEHGYRTELAQLIEEADLLARN